MYSYLAVLNSDNINKYGYRFSIGSLEGVIFKNSVVGVPSLLNHDSHKPIGWNFPIGLYLEPKITKLIGEFFIGETIEDQNEINNAFQKAFLDRNYESCKPFIKDFSKILDPYWNNNGMFICNGCVAYLKIIF